MIECTWVATHDHMPGAELRLTVRGTCTCPSAGYTLGLARSETQGANTRELTLIFDAIPPGQENPVEPGETACEVEFVEGQAPEYDTVTIQGEGGGSVEVSHVH
jgi:hypothetical protein